MNENNYQKEIIGLCINCLRLVGKNDSVVIDGRLACKDRCENQVRNFVSIYSQHEHKNNLISKLDTLVIALIYLCSILVAFIVMRILDYYPFFVGFIIFILGLLCMLLLKLRAQ